MRIAVLFGGPSPERNISAGSIKPWVTFLEADPSVDLAVVFFDRERRPYRLPRAYYYTNTCEDFELDLGADEGMDDGAFETFLRRQDIVLPLLHGEFGEDGELQQKLEALGVPYAFSGPTALAQSLDKGKCYEVLARAGLRVPRFFLITRERWVAQPEACFAEASGLADERLPSAQPLSTLEPLSVVEPLCAVKPLRGGSSLGVGLPAADYAEFATAVNAALEVEEKVLVEEYIDGTEFSVIVMERGASGPFALLPTEVEKRSAVYDTRAKYLHGEGAVLHTPLRRAGSIDACRRAVIDAFAALNMRDLARIDGFLLDDGSVYVTDANGISGMGFSSFSFLQTSLVGMSHADVISAVVDRVCSRVGDGSTRWALTLPAPESATVKLLFGGPTSERQVSRQSGVFVGLCLMARGYDVRFLLMDRSCRFTEIGLFYALHHDVDEILAILESPELQLFHREEARRVGAECGFSQDAAERYLTVGENLELPDAVAGADFVFLALHGGPGENGTLQAALDLLGVPYNGCGPATSSLLSDKGLAAERLREAALDGVYVPRQRIVSRLEMLGWARTFDGNAWDRRFEELATDLGCARVVMKPVDDGCSTGVKVLGDGASLAEFVRAIVSMRQEVGSHDPQGSERLIKLPELPAQRWAFEEGFVDEGGLRYPQPADRDSLRAWFSSRRFVELTCAVIEREYGGLVAAIPSVTPSRGGELSLEEKFQQGIGTNLSLVNFMDDGALQSVRRRVERIAETLGIDGYSRLDLFYDRREDTVCFIEANTLCGLTEATVFYTQILESLGMGPPAALEHIVKLGLAKHSVTAGES